MTPEERVNEETRRETALNLALRYYYNQFQPLYTEMNRPPTTRKVITAAKQFEKFLKAESNA